jgi:putative nucleotidyltransferase with HDIG domain
VVVAAWNEESAIEATLERLAATTYPGAVEVVLADNNSTDRTAELAESAAARLSLDYRRVLETEPGKFHALNHVLETIETLNAAVEARDPYTAGHSQRVRRVSLAIGRELRLSAKQLGALATAALFHDIGKIGMPDSILTKPDTLDRAEAAIMRQHVDRGAEIVARISSLKDSVPAIRHHHERWDGLGYPDRLSGKDVPIQAMATMTCVQRTSRFSHSRMYATFIQAQAFKRSARDARGPSRSSPRRCRPHRTRRGMRGAGLRLCQRAGYESRM